MKKKKDFPALLDEEWTTIYPKPASLIRNALSTVKEKVMDGNA